jgi:hypothetical protein
MQMNCIMKLRVNVINTKNASVVELVDTPDLKSCDLKGRAGSIPARGTYV